MPSEYFVAALASVSTMSSDWGCWPLIGDCGVGAVDLSVEPSAAADAAVGLDEFGDADGWAFLVQAVAKMATATAVREANFRIIVVRSPRNKGLTRYLRAK